MCFSYARNYFFIASCLLYIMAIPQLAHAGERDVKSVVSVDSWQFKDNRVINVARYFDAIQTSLSSFPIVLCDIVAQYMVREWKSKKTGHFWGIPMIYRIADGNMIGSSSWHSMMFYSFETNTVRELAINKGGHWSGLGVCLTRKHMLMIVEGKTQINFINNYTSDSQQLSVIDVLNFGAAISDLVVSPDETMFVVRLVEGSTALYSVNKVDFLRLPLQKFQDKLMRGIAWSGDGTMLLLQNRDTTVNIWKVDTQTLLKTLNFKHSVTRFKAFPHNNDVCVAADDGTVFVYNFMDDRRVITYETPDVVGRISELEISPTGKFVAASCRKNALENVIIWDALTGELCLQSMRCQTLSCSQILFMSDTELVSIMSPGKWQRRFDVFERRKNKPF